MKSNHRCECGCGKKTNMYRGKPRRFIIGHYQRTDEFKEEHSKCMAGENHPLYGSKNSSSTIKKRSQSLKLHYSDEKNRERQSINMIGNKNGLDHVVTKKHKKILIRIMTENNPMNSKKARQKMIENRKGKCVGEDNAMWRGGHKIAIKRRNTKRRGNVWDYIPFNEYFEGCVGHHIDKEVVIHIPEELHKSISHSQNNKESMKKINDAAFAFYTEQFLEEHFPEDLK